MDPYYSDVEPYNRYGGQTIYFLKKMNEIIFREIKANDIRKVLSVIKSELRLQEPLITGQK